MEYFGDNKPVVGILAQETTGIKLNYPDVPYSCFISDAYVKFARAAGAEVLPILLNKDEDYYRELFKKINGIILPGGATFFEKSDKKHDFANVGRLIFKIVEEINDNGIYLPIFGICLGMELMLWITEDTERRDCDMYHGMEKLIMAEDFRESKMFTESTIDEVNMLIDNECCEFHHKFCFVDKDVRSNIWRIISYKRETEEKTGNVKNIITAIESIKYPFYGLQFHPEKPEFEPNSKCPADKKNLAVEANKYFISFFGREISKNKNTFDPILHTPYLIKNDLCETSIWLSSTNKCYMYTE